MLRTFFATAVLVAVALPAVAEELRVVSLNVESDSDTDPALVAEDIDRMERADIWALVEVQDQTSLQVLAEAAGSNHRTLFGESGGADQMAIVYDNRDLELVSNEELTGMGGSRGGPRRPPPAPRPGGPTA